jgi:phosphate starvation-inducible membrane PsiE
MSIVIYFFSDEHFDKRFFILIVIDFSSDKHFDKRYFITILLFFFLINILINAIVVTWNLHL